MELLAGGQRDRLCPEEPRDGRRRLRRDGRAGREGRLRGRSRPRAGAGGGPAPGRPARGAHGAEREVLALMAEGRSNAGIAKRLVVTEGTVEKHVHSILAKLRLPETGDDHRRVLAVVAVPGGALARRTSRILVAETSDFERNPTAGWPRSGRRSRPRGTPRSAPRANTGLGAGEPLRHVEAALLAEVDVHQRDVRPERPRVERPRHTTTRRRRPRSPRAPAACARRRGSPRCRRRSVSAVPWPRR